MKIEKIITPKTTGYLSLASFGGTILSGISKNNDLRKFHRPLAYLTIASTALHIGLIEYSSYKYKKM